MRVKGNIGIENQVVERKENQESPLSFSMAELEFVSELMKVYYPEHEWNNLSMQEKLRIHNKPTIPEDNDPEKELYVEVIGKILKVLRMQRESSRNAK